MKGTLVLDSELRLTETGRLECNRVAPRHSTLLVVRGMSLMTEMRLGLCCREVAFNQDLKAFVSKAGIIRFPEISCAVADIWSGADGSNRPRLQANRPPGRHRRRLQRFIVPVYPQRPVVRAEVISEVLHRIQLRRVRHELDQAYVAWHHQARAGVVARPVPHQHRMDSDGPLLRELLQEWVDHSGVQDRRDQPRGRPGADADRCEHIEISLLSLPHAPRPRSPSGPDPAERPLLSEAGLVLEPDLHVLVGMGLLDGLDLIDDDLLEDRLQLLIRVLVLGPGHQAAEAVAMEQVVDGLEAQEYAEFTLKDAPEVGAVERADAVLGGGPGLESLAKAGQTGPYSRGGRPG